MNIAFPEIAQELIALGAEDQAEIKGHYQKIKSLSRTQKVRAEKELSVHCHQRADRMMKLLGVIKVPSITNIGYEGSEMVSLLALHSYVDVMKTVLAAYQKAYELDPENVYGESIPALTDRIMVVEKRKQLYGNNWMTDKTGKYFMVPVEDFEHMNERRAAFGLGPRMRPTVYATGEDTYPLGHGVARSGDQKELTDEEYADFVAGLIRDC